MRHLDDPGKVTTLAFAVNCSRAQCHSAQGVRRVGSNSVVRCEHELLGERLRAAVLVCMLVNRIVGHCLVASVHALPTKDSIVSRGVDQAPHFLGPGTLYYMFCAADVDRTCLRTVEHLLAAHPIASRVEHDIGASASRPELWRRRDVAAEMTHAAFVLQR